MTAAQRPTIGLVLAVVERVEKKVDELDDRLKPLENAHIITVALADAEAARLRDKAESDERASMRRARTAAILFGLLTAAATVGGFISKLF